ncbi:MAG: HAMP domain-containing histidine kinase, partial [Bacteroidales bacterium]|nr:HAMP domain-containing histidine kinase [Bacteroidales bacterium]
MKFKIISVALLLFATSFAQAQMFFKVKKLNADSLVALLPEKKDIELVEALNLLSNVICRKDIDSSINLASRAIELSEKLEYQKGLADGYFNVGNGYFLLDSIEPTIINYFKAQRIYEDIEPTEEYANLLMQLGVVNYFTGRIEVSKPYNRQANRIYESLNDKEGLFNCNFGMGVYYHVHRPLYLDSVIYYCLKAKSYLDTVNDQNKIAYLYTEIGGAHCAKFYKTGDTSYLFKGIAWSSKGLALPEIDDDAKSHIYSGILYLYNAFKTDDALDSCEAIVNRLRDLCDTCKYLTNVNITATVWLGWISYKRGEYDSALTTWKQCIDLIETELSDFSVNDFDEPINGYNNKQGLKFNKTFVYSYIYEIYHELGDFEKALEYYLLWREIGDEAYLERNQNLITWMGSDSENEKTRNQIAMLARDNELHKMKVKQSRIWLIGLGGVLIIFVFVTILYIRQRKIQSEHKIFVREQKLLHDLELNKVESEKLKELDLLKSKFFANISHEFRTPLTLIMRPLEKVLSKIEDTQHKKDLDVAKKYAGKLQHLINNLLTISKIESGKMQLRTSETDIVKLVNNYVQAFESLARQKNITLNFTNGSEKIKAFVDREKFEQVLNNLLSNAFKFTGDGGEIEIAVCSRQPAKNSRQLAIGKNEAVANCQLPTADLNGQWAEIKISDTGFGISPDHIDHIFDRFYQIEEEN